MIALAATIAGVGAGAGTASAHDALSSPVAHNEFQPVRAVAGFPLRELPQTHVPNPVEVSSLAGHLPGGVMTRAPGFFIHVVKLALGLVHSFAGQSRSQFVTDLDHSTACLSCPASSDGFKTIGKKLTWNGKRLCNRCKKT